mgnify:CR=1 FL=1
MEKPGRRKYRKYSKLSRKLCRLNKKLSKKRRKKSRKKRGKKTRKSRKRSTKNRRKIRFTRLPRRVRDARNSKKFRMEAGADLESVCPAFSLGDNLIRSLEINDRNVNIIVRFVTNNNYDKFKDYIEKLKTCDSDIFDKGFENLFLTSIEEGETIGFFLIIEYDKLKFTYASLVINKNISMELIKSKLDEYNITDKSVELSLLCTNKLLREQAKIIRLYTSDFVNNIICNIKYYIEKDVEYISLVTASKNTEKLLEYYNNRLGFRQFKDTSIMLKKI